MTPAVTVDVEDANGNLITTDTSMVTLTLASGMFANNSPTTSIAAVGGVATFSSMVMNTSGSFSVTASDGSLAASNAAPFYDRGLQQFHHQVARFSRTTTPMACTTAPTLDLPA